MAKRVFTQTFGVVGAIIEKNGKILLVKEAKAAAKDKWNTPAGWLDVGENPVDGAKREVEEETGLQFTPTDILGVYSLVKVKQEGVHTSHPIKIIFLGRVSDERTRELEDDISETKWFTPEEIENMGPDTLRDMDIKKMVKDYFSGKKYPLELLTHTVAE